MHILAKTPPLVLSCKLFPLRRVAYHFSLLSCQKARPRIADGLFVLFSVQRAVADPWQSTITRDGASEQGRRCRG